MGTKSIQLQLLEAAVTLLNASGKPTGLNVHLAREIPIWQDSLPAVVVYPSPSPQGADETVEHVRIPSTRVRRTMNFRTEIRAQVPETSTGVAVLDPLYVWVVKQLAPTNSIALGRVVGPIEVRSASDALNEGDVHLAAKVVEWEIRYDTLRVDPTEG